MKILTNYDFNQNEIQNVAIQRLATAPSTPTPVKGQVYFNTTNNRLFYYNGTVWIGADSIEATMTGDNIITAINASNSLIDNDNLSAGVRDAVAKAHNTHAISDVTGLQNALDGKVDDSQVLTNVPANAKFTDTVTTINSKTGAITKADITALGIPEQDTTYTTFTTAKDGLVPKTTSSNTTDYLRRDGTWASPPDTKYTLPTATSTVLGGIKSGTDITVDASGNVTINDDSHNHVISNIDGLQDALDALPTAAEAQGYATTAEGNANGYTDTAISNLVSSAPATLDTLNELAAALGDDPNFATTVTNNLAAKADKYTATVGDGAKTSYVITHNLNSRDIVIMLRESASPYAQVITDVEMTTVNTVTVKFAVAPATNEYTVIIVG